MIRKVEISGVNTSKLPALSNEEKNELLIKKAALLPIKRERPPVKASSAAATLPQAQLRLF